MTQDCTSDTRPTDTQCRLPLHGLVEMLECSPTQLERLSKTSQDRRLYQELVILWKSLGRPRSGFWQETVVNLTGIWCSYDDSLLSPNDQATAGKRQPERKEDEQ